MIFSDRLKITAIILLYIIQVLQKAVTGINIEMKDVTVQEIFRQMPGKYNFKLYD